MKIKFLLKLFLVNIIMLFPAKILAATCGGILNPVLVLPTTLLFGLYDASSPTHTDINSSITVTCTITLGTDLPDFTASLSAGGANSFSPRKMSLLGNSLNYNIYTTSGYTTVWGDGSGATGTVPATGNDGQKILTGYGRLFKNQFIPIGLYTDLITITISF